MLPLGFIQRLQQLWGAQAVSTKRSLHLHLPWRSSTRALLWCKRWEGADTIHIDVDPSRFHSCRDVSQR